MNEYSVPPGGASMLLPSMPSDLISDLTQQFCFLLQRKPEPDVYDIELSLVAFFENRDSSVLDDFMRTKFVEGLRNLGAQK